MILQCFVLFGACCCHSRRKVLNTGGGGGGGGGRGGGGKVKNIAAGGNLFVGCKMIRDSNIKNRIEGYTFINTFK